jgi:hypothetical protein
MASSFVSLFTNELEKHNSCSKETVKLRVLLTSASVALVKETKKEIFALKTSFFTLFKL